MLFAVASLCPRLPLTQLKGKMPSFFPWVMIVLLMMTALPVANAQSVVAGNVRIAPGIATVVGGGFTLPGITAIPATSASLDSPSAAVMDGAGNLFVADSGNNLVEEVSATTGQIVVVAGGGSIIPSGTAVAATSASLNSPAGVALDGAGNLYIADSGNNLVEEVSATTGQIVAVVGSGSTIPNSTATPANNALLNGPTGVAVDGAGNLYIADSLNDLVEEVSATTGEIVVVAGGGSTIPSTAAIAATNARLGEPRGVALDAAGDLYIADAGNNQIDEVSATTGKIMVVAGGGSAIPGTNTLLATSASLSGPNSVAVDGGSNLYIADSGHGLIEKLTAATKSISAIGGGGNTGPSMTAIPAINALLNSPTGVALDRAGNLYVVDQGNSQIEKMSPSTTLPATAVASTSMSQNVFIQLTSASNISAITVIPSSNSVQEFAVDAVNGCDTTGNVSNAVNTICTVLITFSPVYPGLRTGTLTISDGSILVGAVGLYAIGQGPMAAQSPGGIKSLVGGGSTIPSNAAIPGAMAQLGAPVGVALDGTGNLYIADFQNNLIEKVSAKTGQVEVVAGGGSITPSTSPIPATSALLNGPEGVALDAAGNLYIADYWNGFIERVSATTGQIVVVAGGGGTIPTSTPISPTSAEFCGPASVAVDGAGNLYIADSANYRIEEMSAATGQIVAIAGTGLTKPGTTAIPATEASLNLPTGVAVDGLGNLYIADSGANLIERVSLATEQIVVVAGGGTTVPTTAAIAAINAKLVQPRDVVIDAAGDIYIADYFNNQVERVTAATGQIAVVVGGGNIEPTPATLRATSASLGNPFGLALDGAGNLYIADVNNQLIEQVSASAFLLDFPTTDVGAPSAAQTVTLANIGNMPLTFASLATTTSFNIDDATTTCTPSTPLGAGASCAEGVVFQPMSAGDVTGTLSITDNNLNETGAVQQIDLSGTATTATPTITWPTPAGISYGTALGAKQLNATASFGGNAIAGTFVYSPAAGSIPVAGTDTLSATFAPEDSTDYATATATVSLTVAQASPTITWATPAAITSGTALSATQLNATASFQGSPLAGTFAYLPAAGTILTAGTYTLSAIFTPQDIFDFATATATVTLTVTGADFTLTPGLGSTSQTVEPGASATFTFTVAPTGSNEIFNNDVTFGVAGLPSEWQTPTFSPAKIAAGTSGAQKIMMTIQTGTQTTLNGNASSREPLASIALAFMLLPLLGVKSMKRRRDQVTRALPLMVLAALSLGVVLGLGSCGGKIQLPQSSQQTYTLVMTASSGDTTNSTTVTLTVQ